MGKYVQQPFLYYYTFVYLLTSSILLEIRKYISLSLSELTSVLFIIYLKVLACVGIIRCYRMISEERFGKDKKDMLVA